MKQTYTEGIEKSIQNKIDRLVEILKNTVNGDCAIALAGSLAKGIADMNSDIDLFLFTDNPKPYEERLQIIRQYADADTNPCVTDNFNLPWGGSIDFTFEQTPVEVVVRIISQMDKRVNDCLEGQFEIIPQTWTSNGYYTFTYLCELSFIKAIWDPTNLIQNYKTKITPYPLKLKKNIIDCFMGRASTWMDNFHYQSAIRRQDILFTCPIVLHTILDIIQVLFAYNEVYFIGDKKLELALSKLNYCPSELLDQLELLLSAPKNTEQLLRQSEILSRIINEIKVKVN